MPFVLGTTLLQLHEGVTPMEERLLTSHRCICCPCTVQVGARARGHSFYYLSGYDLHNTRRQTWLTYNIILGLMALFLYYVLLFGIYQSATTTINLVASWALNQVRSLIIQLAQ